MPALRRLLTVLTLWLLWLPGSAAADGTDWPHVRGPQTASVSAEDEVFDDGVSLSLAWRVPLGSGYSGIAVAGGRAVTLFGDGEEDWVVALDGASGEELWRYDLGATHQGRDGSHDGPLSSPSIGGGKVFALSPDGTLVALGLEDGAPVWQTDLPEAFGSKAPHFGFSTTPLPDGDLVIVQVGGTEGRTIAGLRAADGEVVWSHGDGEVSDQSPAIMTLAGRRQVVAVSAGEMLGLDAATGDLLWRHELTDEDRASSANPAPMGEDRFLVPMSGGLTAYRVASGDGGFTVQELYRTRTLGASYAPPIYYNGYVYGFRGQILTCMDPETGERVWRSRPPGGDGLILVDGHLVIFGSKGYVVVVEATPEGYREKGRVLALDASSLTWPSFAGGRIFVRNLEEMAAVDVRTEAAPEEGVQQAARSSSPEVSTAHAFGRWVFSLQAADPPYKEAIVEGFLRRNERWPLVETVGETTYVHFLYQGAAEDVAISGSWLDTAVADSLHPLEGTDLFYRTYQLEPGLRWEYRFRVDFEEWALDDRNPRTVPSLGGGSLSELVMDGYGRTADLDPAAEAPGKTETFTLTSEHLGYAKEVTVWLPPGYEAGGEEAYPLLVVNRGKHWQEQGLLPQILGRETGKTVAPAVVAFVEAYGQWWIEAGGTRTAEYARMLAEELVPALEERYRLRAEPASRALWANHYFGLTTAYTVLQYPQAFGAAVIQSPLLTLGEGDAVDEAIAARKAPAARFYVDWEEYAHQRADQELDARKDGWNLFSNLVEAGYAVHGGQVADSYGWGALRNRTAGVLAWLFPVE